MQQTRLPFSVLPSAELCFKSQEVAQNHSIESHFMEKVC